MDKRIMLFLDYSKRDQEDIKFMFQNYFKEKFGKSYGKIDIQTFYDIGESINLKKKIGVGGEILVMFDKRSLSRFRHEETKRLCHDVKEVLSDMSEKFCKEEGIPTFTFGRDIENREELEKELEMQLDNIKPYIENRLKRLETEVGSLAYSP